MIRVLVVDDDFMVAKVHSGFVSRIDGFEVCGVAHSAEAALTAVGELQPDLVLLDVHLPGTTGLDLIAPFRELAPELDVLVITSEREAGSVKKALRSGVVHYLMKPFTFEVLRERLERYRSTYANLDSTGEAEQDAVDEAFGVAGGAAGASSLKGLPKGLSPETLQLVETALRDDTEPASATDISERVGISRASARRYLEYLYESGRSTTSLKYGVVGRPERRYVWKR
ncbi:MULTISPECIES: response regulator [Rhodococcus]|jgi:response regulator of citrate/malate metabolism|uniref:Transcriptional regulatory protein n=1 Tax=Rhodococcus baikonurensis TaxID=172041 RepID=A0ABV5XC87_9NOCA|nr:MULTISPECIES: response regulator [Rhodococcus]MBJ7480994.1 response regulator [Rhodococcus sp. (in: high G+C Gram-positive bacteria)]MDI9957735.1 response regulator [Rhodococcus sp. IEGM 1237]MDI9963190.1 response regulator [Rhodococcus sp. IEGM 1251]MDV8124913.1 response regulator [Rhodococcus sp. IEGM 1304]UJC77397.1 response regulator [Rhodococcus erythropolis]